MKNEDTKTPPTTGTPSTGAGQQLDEEDFGSVVSVEPGENEKEDDDQDDDEGEAGLTREQELDYVDNRSDTSAGEDEEEEVVTRTNAAVGPANTSREVTLE